MELRGDVKLCLFNMEESDQLPRVGEGEGRETTEGMMNLGSDCEAEWVLCKTILKWSRSWAQESHRTEPKYRSPRLQSLKAQRPKGAEADAVEDVAKYVVCNPATEEWTVLPAIEELHPRNVIRLGFDPAAPSRFAVFVLLQDVVEDHDAGVQIFSSETGTWTFRQSDWGEGSVTVDYYNGSPSTFFGGTLHLTTRDNSVITVDTEGKTWHKIRMPLSVEEMLDIGYIGHSQERLYALHMNYSDDDCQLTVWVLEDYATGQWTLKHTADMSETVGDDEVCTFVAVDSEGNLIFQINGRDEQLVSYDMEKRKFHVIFSFESYFTLRCDPYIPTYKEWLPKAAP
uniref:F-box protein At3g26010-like beta-propeller domain-containing protein n=1 Tax=Aegilops tauschii TaxID=37682 RepID=R7W742_AEGTA